ncbi:MAG: VWA domain-containing protein [Treponema sp.]|nr:VWA domain-containing protein [Treponema sp.]
MNFSIERPWALYGIPFIIPALIYCAFIYKKTFTALYKSSKRRRSQEFINIKKRVITRIVLRVSAWCMMIFALAGFSWETVSTPTQKNGNAIAYVFDISYSMTARDCPNNLTRLEAAASFASNLLDKTEGIPSSAVLAKGGAAIAVPLTEDNESIRALLRNLSPKMMTSAGSGLGEGINEALKSFPQTISKAPVIWLFTDGEETDNSLQNALRSALRRGANVVIIGFGEEREIEIISGDGKTPVKTALRSQKIKEAVNEANKKNLGGQGFRFIKSASVKFVDATEIGSARKILSTTSAFSGDGDSTTMAYEVQTVDHHKLFITLGIILFALSFFASEFSLKGAKEALAISLIAMNFVSCSNEFNESKKILGAVWNWNQKKYTEAVAGFSQCLTDAEANDNQLIKQYALYGLSATYLMQNENKAAMEKINALSGNAPDKIRFASFYNSGIIAQREGDYKKAVELFKNALLIDPTNVKAKVNLELSRSQQVQRAHESERQMIGADEMSQEESDLQKSVFNRIREKDQQQWKNNQKEQKSDSSLDY